VLEIVIGGKPVTIL